MDVHSMLEKHLNPAQQEAVTTIEGPLLVVAGAGTGKTRVIEYRVLYLVEQRVPPTSILLLTFTRRAAREMLSRASGHNSLCEQVKGGTFHSFGFSIITEFADLLGYKRPLSFLDEADSEELIYRLSATLGYRDKKMRFPTRRTLKAVISASFNRDEPIEQILLKDYPHFVHWAKEIERLREDYVTYKVGHNLLDYDDLLIYVKLLLNDKTVRNAVGDRYRYVMVDEYQDTNRVQADIVYLLGKEHRNVMVVGDDAQSIYAFRGARYQNMFDFLNAFPDAKIVKLEENYRSAQPILDLANAIIDRAPKKHTKVLRAHKEGKEKPTLLFFKDPEPEAEWVAEKVKELWEEGIPLHHMGVLFRSMYLVRPLEISLTKRGIPYRTYGGLKFIETAHIKDLIAHIRIVANPRDELSWHRALMLLDGVGPKTANSAVSNIIRAEDWRPVLSSLRDRARSGVAIGKLVSALSEVTQRDTPFPDVVNILADYYRPILEDHFDDYQRRMADIDSLKQIAKSYESIESFLLDLVAIEPAEKSVDERLDLHLDVRPLVLSTIHSAKGLEWQVVFILGLADGHLPISYSLNAVDDIEEERRLLYVAITRAKQELFLTLAHEGFRGGITTFSRLSRFLDDPDAQALLDLSGKDQMLLSDRVSEPLFEKQDLVRRILGRKEGDSPE